MEKDNAHRPSGRRVACLLLAFLRGGLTHHEHERPLYQDLLVPPLPMPDRVATDETPLQKASREGSVGDVTKLLDEKDGCLTELTPRWETPLHLAARNGHLEVTRVLLDHAKGRSYCRPFIKARNFRGETALHLATSRNDVQVLKLLLEDSTLAGIVEVNAKTNGGFTALDILDSSSETEEVKEEIEKILQRAGGARGNVTKVLKDGSNHEVLIKVDDHFRNTRPFPSKASRSRQSVDGAHVALLLATMFATMTFHAALRIDSLSAIVLDHQLSVQNIIQERRVEAVVFTRVFVLFNSMAFFSSLGLITILLHHLPLLPWLLILVASFSGAYICAVMASTSVDEAMTVALLGASVLTAAIVNCVAYKFNKLALNYLQWISKRYAIVQLDWGCRNTSYCLLQELSS